MDFKLVSKNNMGLVMSLILVILLSQSRMLNFLIDAHLGRIVLLAFVILIAYTNKILGLVAVLFIIIAFNNNDMNTVYSYNMYEGFDGSGNTLDASGSAIQTVVQNKLNALSQATSSQTATATSSLAATSSTPTETFKGGREGFCMTDRESNILKGKQSNSIPVYNNLRDQPDDVSPTDHSIFSDSYAAF
jgi:hypothetical protein